jgi:hypothetical protein
MALIGNALAHQLFVDISIDRAQTRPSTQPVAINPTQN